jgi:hypothetical protein
MIQKELVAPTPGAMTVGAINSSIIIPASMSAAEEEDLPNLERPSGKIVEGIGECQFSVRTAMSAVSLNWLLIKGDAPAQYNSGLCLKKKVKVLELILDGAAHYC